MSCKSAFTRESPDHAHWLSVRTARPADVGGLKDHLLRLSADDRSLRFSAGVVLDDTIRSYAARIRFGHDVVVCLVDGRGMVVGLAHGCIYRVHGRLHVEAAFSVDAAWRGRGWGTLLMREVQAQASGSGAVRVVGLCAARNRRMRRVFEGTGMRLDRVDDEIQAHCDLQPAGAGA